MSSEVAQFIASKVSISHLTPPPVGGFLLVTVPDGIPHEASTNIAASLAASLETECIIVVAPDGFAVDSVTPEQMADLGWYRPPTP